MLYRLYIDESGDHTYGKQSVDLRISSPASVIEVPRYADLEDDRKRYLSLTGCIVERDFYDTVFREEMTTIKKKHFSYDPDDPFVFHRDDIINKRRTFYCLRNPEKEALFNNDLLEFMGGMTYWIITVVIDKKAHIEKYGGAAYHPYHYCLTVMLERYCGLLSLLAGKGDVLAESRGRREDEQLKKAYAEIYDGGSHWVSRNRFQNVLTSREIKLKKKDHNIAGLQLADMLAHPLKVHTLVENGRITVQDGFGSKIVATVIGKFNKNLYNGRIDGYGRVLL